MTDFYVKHNTRLKLMVSIWNTTLGWNGWFLYETQHWIETAGFHMKYSTDLKWAGFYMKYSTGLKWLASIWNTTLGWNHWFSYEIRHWLEMAGFYMKYNTEFKSLVSIWNTTLGWNGWFLYEIQLWVEMAGFYMKYNTGLKLLVSIWNTTLGWNRLNRVYRSSRSKIFCMKSVLRNFLNFTGIHSLRPATLLKKRLWHRFFPVNFEKILCVAR